MISDLWKYNGTPLYPFYIQKSEIMNFYEKEEKKPKNIENIPLIVVFLHILVYSGEKIF